LRALRQGEHSALVANDIKREARSRSKCRVIALAQREQFFRNNPMRRKRKR